MLKLEHRHYKEVYNIHPLTFGPLTIALYPAYVTVIKTYLLFISFILTVQYVIFSLCSMYSGYPLQLFAYLMVTHYTCTCFLLYDSADSTYLYILDEVC